MFVYSRATNIIVDPHEVRAVLFLDRNSDFFGKDDEYGVPELPFEEYEVVPFFGKGKVFWNKSKLL